MLVKKNAVQDCCAEHTEKCYPKTANAMLVKKLPRENVARNSARKTFSTTGCIEFLVEYTAVQKHSTKQCQRDASNKTANLDARRQFTE